MKSYGHLIKLHGNYGTKFMNIVKTFHGNFWRNKKVLITGHNGFKGSWLTLFLMKLGAEIYGISLKNDDPNSLFNKLKIKKNIYEKLIDIRNINLTKDAIKDFSPDIIFHLAAQPLVRESYLKPVETWSTNVMGTISILEAIREYKKKIIFIGITTDKVYDNKEWIYGYRETDRLGGIDPYSSSKAAAELAINAWRNSFASNSNYLLSSARAGNVIGGGDYANDRIIPDIFRSIQENKTLNIRNPESTRPWQHVLDPLWGYILLAEKMDEHSSFSDCYNFGPELNSNRSVQNVVDAFSKFIKIKYKNLSPTESYKESKLLHLTSEKAKNALNWNPVWDFEKTIYKTASWYIKLHKNISDELSLCNEDIAEFMKDQDI